MLPSLGYWIMSLSIKFGFAQNHGVYYLSMPELSFSGLLTIGLSDRDGLHNCCSLNLFLTYFEAG